MEDCFQEVGTFFLGVVGGGGGGGGGDDGGGLGDDDLGATVDARGVVGKLVLILAVVEGLTGFSVVATVGEGSSHIINQTSPYNQIFL